MKLPEFKHRMIENFLRTIISSLVDAHYPWRHITSVCMTASPRHSVYVSVCSPFPRYTCTMQWPRHSVYVYQCISVFLDTWKNRVRVDEELRQLHNHRRARCLDDQCNAHCRLCTVGLRRTKRHCSSQFREYVATNYRPKRRILGRVSVYKTHSTTSQQRAIPVQCTADSEWLCIGTKIKS